MSITNCYENRPDKPQKWELISSVLESMTGLENESFDFSEHLFIINKLVKVLLFQENYALKCIVCLSCLKLPHLHSQKQFKKNQKKKRTNSGSSD